jgi:hypothetical protein
MTSQKSFKRLVRARAQKTGESYTAARAMLLAEPPAEPSAATAPTVLATSDDKIRERTGRGWEEWFDLLDEWGAADRPRRETSRWVAEQLGIHPLAWNAQAIVGSYERARGLRAAGEHADGYRVSVSKTIAAPVARLFAAFVDERLRETWLPDAPLRERTATAPKSARFDWDGGPGRVHVVFDAKGDAKSTAFVTHARLADAGEAERLKAFWRERLAALKAQLEHAERAA